MTNAALRTSKDQRCLPQLSRTAVTWLKQRKRGLPKACKKCSEARKKDSLDIKVYHGTRVTNVCTCNHTNCAGMTLTMYWSTCKGSLLSLVCRMKCCCIKLGLLLLEMLIEMKCMAGHAARGLGVMRVSRLVTMHIMLKAVLLQLESCSQGPKEQSFCQCQGASKSKHCSVAAAPKAPKP